MLHPIYILNARLSGESMLKKSKLNFLVCWHFRLWGIEVLSNSPITSKLLKPYEHFQKHYSQSPKRLILFCLKGLFIWYSFSLGCLPAGVKLEFAMMWVCCLALKRANRERSQTLMDLGDNRLLKWHWAYIPEPSAACSLPCTDNSWKVLL